MRCTDCENSVAGPGWLRCFEHAYQRTRALLSPVPLLPATATARRFNIHMRVLVLLREKECVRRGLAADSVLEGTIVRVGQGRALPRYRKTECAEYVVVLDAGGRYYAATGELREAHCTR